MSHPQQHQQYVYLLCAILFSIAVGWSAHHTELWLTRPSCKSRVPLNRASFRTGDLILFSSKPSLRTDVEKLLCGSHYTHVAMVFVDAARVPHLWECVRTGHRVRRLSARMLQKNRCYWRRISKPLDGAALEWFIMQNCDQPYSFNMWRGVMRRWCTSLNLPHSTASPHLVTQQPRFCSQLVADTYAHFGALDFSACDNLAPRMVLPGDFCAASHTTLPWQCGYSLSGELELLPPRPPFE